MISYMKTEFGFAAARAVARGDRNSNWYLDQKIISILIFDWIKQHGPDRVKLLYRNEKKDRSASNNNHMKHRRAIVL